jgi:hypothetical protein
VQFTESTENKADIEGKEAERLADRKVDPKASKVG